MRKRLKKRRIQVVGGIDAIKNNEGAIIEFVGELIDDSFAVGSSYRSSHTGQRVSKNLKHLAEVIADSSFLDNSMRFANNESLSFPQLQLYRLVLTHLALDEHASVPHCFEYSQKAVYGHPLDYPLFTDGPLKSKLNLDNLLHIVNFFKYHIVNRDEYSLHAPFQALPDEEKPRAWDFPVKTGAQKLGTHWKGCLAYLDNVHQTAPRLRGNTPGYFPPTDPRELRRSRTNLPPPPRRSSDIYSDVIDVEDTDDGFLSLQLDFSRRPAPWPASFERHLASKANTYTPLHQEPTAHATAPEIPYHQFQGLAHTPDQHLCAGYVSALPAQDPQHVHPVPGFQRITMIAWFAPADEALAPTAVEKHLAAMHGPDGLARAEVEHWAYEGVVLPGGNIMLVSVIPLPEAVVRQRHTAS
ncbi:hypothetical protein MMC26_005582 [Xylographa opegraphella]|nr:hypothetical protein [Xylographa opegraphella]